MRNIRRVVTGLLILCLGMLYDSADTRAEGGSQKWAFKTGGAVISSPAIDSDGTIYVGSNDGNLYAIHPDGRLKWIFVTKGAVHSRPAIDSDGTIYVGSWDRHLYALRPDGSLKWKFLTKGPVSSSPALGPDRMIYVCSQDHFIYAIRPGGSLKWAFATKGEVFSSPAIGPDGTVYTGSWDKHVYAISGASFEVSGSTGTQKEEKEVKTERVVKSEPLIIKDIQFEKTLKGEDKVTFFLSGHNLPSVFSLSDERPRLVCDFDASFPGGRIRPERAVKGNIIRKIRMAFHKRPKMKTRIVMDLALGRKYGFEEKYFEEEHIFVLVVKPAKNQQK